MKTAVLNLFRKLEKWWRIHFPVKFHDELCLTVYLNKIKILIGKHFFCYFKENLDTLLEIVLHRYSCKSSTLEIVHFQSLKILDYLPLKLVIFFEKVLFLTFSIVLMSILKVCRPFTRLIFYKQISHKRRLSFQRY